jgi:hypothetical protein
MSKQAVKLDKEFAKKLVALKRFTDNINNQFLSSSEIRKLKKVVGKNENKG